jgi:protein-tyrosine phosphatase
VTLTAVTVDPSASAGSVLFVCHANICRSPLAAALLTGLARDAGAFVRTSSAGVRAHPGRPMSEGSLVELVRRGYPPPDHASRLITPDLVLGADLVVTASASQRSDVGALAPAAWPRTFALDELARLLAGAAAPGGTIATVAETAHARRRIPPQIEFDDLADPIGREQAQYTACADTILAALAPVVARIARR